MQRVVQCSQMKIDTLERAQELTEKIFRRLGRSVRTGSLTRDQRVFLTSNFIDRLKEPLQEEVIEWLNDPINKRKRVEYFLAGDQLPKIRPSKDQLKDSR